MILKKIHWFYSLGSVVIPNDQNCSTVWSLNHMCHYSLAGSPYIHSYHVRKRHHYAHHFPARKILTHIRALDLSCRVDAVLGMQPLSSVSRGLPHMKRQKHWKRGLEGPAQLEQSLADCDIPTQ